MATNLPVFTDEDRNRAKNKKASDKAIPFVYETVIAWGCKKDDDETYLGYYERRLETVWNDNKEAWEKDLEKRTKDLEKRTKGLPEEDKKKEKKKCIKKFKNEKLKHHLITENWTQEEEEHLKRETCEGLDATLLHKLVPTICDGIGHYNPNTPSSTEIEKFLRELKNKRNDICHDPKGFAISETILDEIEVSAVKVFNAAGVLYASFLDKQKVQDKIDELKKMLQKMKEEVMTDDYQRILQTAKKMSVDGVAEMRVAVMKQATDFLPLSDDKVTLSDVFHPVDLLINEHEDDNNDTATDNNQKEETKREIICHELIDHFKGNNVLCEGHPGTGKTTLLKTLREDFVAQGKEKFRGVRKFDLLLHMECRNNSVTTIDQLLEQHFPKSLLQLNKDEAVMALYELNLLICVDGLDELTSCTRKLLEELIEKFGHSGSATFIFTSRPGRAQSISLSYQTLTLQPVKEENQVEFLRRYQTNIGGFKGSDLITAFQALNDTCKACFCQPVNLALFCGIFRSSPSGVKNWHNELNIMDTFLRLSKKTMKTRMDKMDLENTDCYAEEVTDAVADLGLCLLQKQEMTVDVETYTRMGRDIFRPRDVPYYSIFSAFFTRLADQQTFQFFHKSTIEFLAAKAILKRLLDKPTNGVFSSINAIINDRRGWMQSSHDVTSSASDVAPAPVVTNGEDASVGRNDDTETVHPPSKGAPVKLLSRFCRCLKKSNSDDADPAPGVALAAVSTDGIDVLVGQFDNVFRFLTMMLAEGGPATKEAMNRFLKEVYPALTREQIGFHYWVEITISCHEIEEIVEAAAKAAKTVSEKETSANQRKWQITTRRDMRAVSLMLPYHQPVWLDIKPLRSEGLSVELNPLLKAVAQWHTGILDLFLEESFYSFSAIDDLVICLKSARCALRQFQACIGQSREAWQVIAAAVRTAKRVGVLPTMSIALADPRQHQLDKLEGTRHLLFVLAQLNPREVRQRCPLPRCSERPPELRVNCRLATGEAVPEIASLIEDLSPKDGQYRSMYLQQWQGTDAELPQLLQRLRASGVSTDGMGRPRWIPRGTFRDGRCSLCYSIHQEGWGRCVQLLVPERDPRDQIKVTRVNTDDDMRQVASGLPHFHLPWLAVTTRRSGAPPPALRLLMEAVAKWHRGNLDLNFYHSYQDFVPADELLALLHLARCPIVLFRGCLSGSSVSAWLALVDGVKRAERAGMRQVLLAISLLDQRQHELRHLDGTQHALSIRVRLPSSPGGRRPLPTSSYRPPQLIVQFPPTAGSNGSDDGETTAELAAALIEDLAPKNMRYLNVYLQHYPGTDGALDDMVARLMASGVRTGNNTPSWTVASKDSDMNCIICCESSHRPGERCLQLLLP